MLLRNAYGADIGRFCVRSGWWAVVVIVAMPLVAAEPDPAYRGTTYTKIVDVAVDDLEASADPTPVDPVAFGFGSCGADEHLVRKPDEGWIRFVESSQEAGCAEVVFTIKDKSPVESMRVTFMTDRNMDAVVDSDLGARFRQEVRFYSGSNIAENVHVVFSDQSVEEDLTGHEIKVDSPHTLQRIGWFFQDRSGAQPNAGGLAGYAFTAELKDVRLHFDDIPLADAVNERAYSQSTTEHALFETSVAATVSPAMLEGGHVELRFAIANTHSLLSIQRPDGGLLSVEQLRTAEAAGTLSVFVAADDPGTYTARFASREPLRTNAWMIPAVGLLGLAPLGAGVFASMGARRFEREAVDEFRATAHTLRLTLMFLWFIYAGMIVLVLWRGLLPLVTSWPLRLEAALLHVGLALLAVSFVGLGTYWHRSLRQAMDQELAEKAAINADLVRSNEELEQFAYIASHDLQEPLRTISNFSDLLVQRSVDPEDAEAKEFAAYIQDGTRRMKGLINDLLDYSRVSTKRRPFEPVDLNETLAIVTRSLQAAIEERQAVVTVDDLPTVHADPNQMIQLFMNLVGNALKFRHPRRRPRVRITATRDGATWRIAVTDNGLGIPPDDHDRIFVIFQRLHRSDELPGTGIGLAICHKIVTQHGGKIWVAPDSTKGTTFFLRLPSTPVEV